MILLRSQQVATLLAFCTACTSTSHDVSGTWQARVTDSATCPYCNALFGFKLEQSSAGAIKGLAVSDVIYKDDAASGDAAAIAVCLASLGYATAPALVAEKLSALMGSSSDTVLVAEDPTTGIVGVVSVHLVPLFHAAGNLARLTALAVGPGHQRKGVGRALVAAAEAFAWERDCRRVEV